MSGFRIQPMESHQAEHVAQLFHQVWHETQGPLQDSRIARHRDLDFFRRRVAQRPTRTLVALTDQRVGGFSAWTGDCLNSLFVTSAFRRLGLGNALCGRTERAMLDAGCRHVGLNCIQGNWPARRFYEEQGWRCEGLVTFESLTPEGLCKVSAWKMVKDLNPA